jgi:hypothetical protein
MTVNAGSFDYVRSAAVARLQGAIAG